MDFLKVTKVWSYIMEIMDILMDIHSLMLYLKMRHINIFIKLRNYIMISHKWSINIERITYGKKIINMQNCNKLK